MAMGLKARTIRMICARKYDTWLASLPQDMQELLKGKGIITGGSIANMLLGEPVKDYDVYFTTMEAAQTVAEYYLKQFMKNVPATFSKNWKISNTGVTTIDGRVRIMLKSVGVASEQQEKEYTYFEQLDTQSPETEEFVEEVMAAKTEQDQAAETKEDKKFRPIFLSSNAVTLSDKVQLIIRFYGEPSEIHTNFDFVHCTSYWSSSDRQLHLVPAAL
jgi:hypothetical protein